MEGINVDLAQGIAGEMVHGEVEDVREILLRRIWSQIGDCQEGS